MQNVPIDITNEKIAKLRDHINSNFDAVNPDGSLNLDKAQRNVAYSIGNIYTNYNGLLLQEKHKLIDIETDLKMIKAITYDEIKRTQLAYDVDSKGVLVILDGHEKVRKKQSEYDKQQAYVEFLENTLKQIGYYANGVRVMLQKEEIKLKYG